MDSVLRNYFAEGRIRKTKTDVFEIRRDLDFRRAGGCGRNAGRLFFYFLHSFAFYAKLLGMNKQCKNSIKSGVFFFSFLQPRGLIFVL